MYTWKEVCGDGEQGVRHGRSSVRVCLGRGRSKVTTQEGERRATTDSQNPSPLRKVGREVEEEECKGRREERVIWCKGCRG